MSSSYYLVSIDDIRFCADSTKFFESDKCGRDKVSSFFQKQKEQYKHSDILPFIELREDEWNKAMQHMASYVPDEHRLGFISNYTGEFVLDGTTAAEFGIRGLDSLRNFLAQGKYVLQDDYGKEMSVDAFAEETGMR